MPETRFYRQTWHVSCRVTYGLFLKTESSKSIAEFSNELRAFGKSASSVASHRAAMLYVKRYIHSSRTFLGHKIMVKCTTLLQKLLKKIVMKVPLLLLSDGNFSRPRKSCGSFGINLHFKPRKQQCNWPVFLRLFHNTYSTSNNKTARSAKVCTYISCEKLSFLETRKLKA